MNILGGKSIDENVNVPVDNFMISSIKSEVTFDGLLNRKLGIVLRVIVLNLVKSNTRAKKANSSKTL